MPSNTGFSASEVIITPFLPERYFSQHLPGSRSLDLYGLRVLHSGRMAVIRCGIGEKAVKSAMALAKASGVKKLLFLGSCGAIGGLEIGAIALPSRAQNLKEQSTEPEEKYFKELEKYFTANGINISKPAVCSVDSVENESRELVSNLSGKGVGALDLELFYFYAEAKRLGMAAAAVLYVTDQPFVKPFDGKHSAADREKIIIARDRAVKTSLDFLSGGAKQPLRELVLEKTGLKLGVNKLNELSRLVFEISKREGKPAEDILSEGEIARAIGERELGVLDKFSKIKQYLIKRRYPVTHALEEFSVFFPKLEEAATDEIKHRGAFYPERIFIENASAGSLLAENVRRLYPDVPCEQIASLKDYRSAGRAAPGLGKRELFVAEQKWDFAKACPCTKGAVCCDYHVINLGFGCPYDCSYCYLQHYTNSPGIVIDSNVEDFVEKFDEYLLGQAERLLRIGTGEFTDSLALDHITGYSKRLVPYFSAKNVLFELKTKSDNVSNLIGLEHNGKTVVSWSLNPGSVVKDNELGSASLEKRLAAAKKCFEAGYKIGFHFDPIIYFPSWEKEYREVVDMMLEAVPRIEWISLGTLRFHRSLKAAAEKRFPGAAFLYDEMLAGFDKKIRYHTALRAEIYKKMSSWINKGASGARVYLCMEPTAMWKEVLNTGASHWYW